MLLLHVLLSCNHTKTCILLFYWFLVLIGLNRLVYSWITLFLSFLLLINYLKKCLLYDSWLWYNVIPSCFGCYKLGISIFHNIFTSFSENCIIHQFEKIFFNYFCPFFLALPSYQCMVLTKLLDWISSFKLLASRMASILIYDIMLVSIFLYLIFYIYPRFYHVIWLQFFSTFSIFILSGKNDKSFVKVMQFFRIFDINFKKISFIIIFIIISWNLY